MPRAFRTILSFCFREKQIADVAAENASVSAGGARSRGGGQFQIFSATSFAVALPAQSLFAAGLAGEG